MFGRNKTNQQSEQPTDTTGASKPITRLAHDPETHLEQYLAYYVSTLEPGYAVLVTGGWGTGKTHQVTTALPESHAHYITLFGLKTVEEIEGKIFAAMYPGKSALKKLAEKVDGTTIELPLLGALGTGGLGSVLTSIFIKNDIDTRKTLIFDDLERAAIKIRSLLGLINSYVEHHKCRVIVIAHDEKLVSEFKEAKEKIFGQTLVIEPDIDAAFASFVKRFAKEDEAEYLTKLKNEILPVFKESKTSSLRVLRHVVEDVGRLVAALDVRHLENEKAMVELIRVFSSLAIEVRHGAIDRGALQSRRLTLQYHRAGLIKSENPPAAILEVAEKYASFDIASTILQDDVLVEMLMEGRFVPNHIKASLDSSAFFIEGQVSPPWQLVSGFDKLDDAIVDQALQRMEEQFSQRQITDSGELLHVVALKMMMASTGFFKETIEDVKKSSISYIDDLLTQKKLPPRPAGSDWIEIFNRSSGSVLYWIDRSYVVEFDAVLEHLIAARIKAMDFELPHQVPSLLNVVRTSGKEFFAKICFDKSGRLEFDDIPILAHVDPSEFVDAWLASPKDEWYWTGRALKERLQAAHSHTSLAQEEARIGDVHRIMHERARETSGLARLRIERAAQLIGLPLLD